MEYRAMYPVLWGDKRIEVLIFAPTRVHKKERGKNIKARSFPRLQK